MVVAIGLLLGIVIVGCVVAITTIPDTIRKEKRAEELKGRTKRQHDGEV